MWMTSCTGSVRGGFWKFEKSQWVEFLPPKKKVNFQSSPRPCGGCCTWFGVNGKVVTERLCLMSKNIFKRFVPKLRSRKCFSCFGIPMLSIYELGTFYVYFTYLYHGYVTVGPDRIIKIGKIELNCKHTKLYFFKNWTSNDRMEGWISTMESTVHITQERSQIN